MPARHREGYISPRYEPFQYARFRGMMFSVNKSVAKWVDGKSALAQNNARKVSQLTYSDVKRRKRAFGTDFAFNFRATAPGPSLPIVRRAIGRRRP